MQTELGDLYDAVVAEEWLRRAALRPRTPSATALAAGELIARSEQAADRARAEWPGAWKRARQAWRDFDRAGG